MLVLLLSKQPKMTFLLMMFFSSGLPFFHIYNQDLWKPACPFVPRDIRNLNIRRPILGIYYSQVFFILCVEKWILSEANSEQLDYYKLLNHWLPLVTNYSVKFIKLVPKHGPKSHDLLAVPEKYCLKRRHLMVYGLPNSPPPPKNPS